MKKKYKKVVRKEKKSMQRDIGLIKDDRETEQIFRKRERACIETKSDFKKADRDRADIQKDRKSMQRDKSRYKAKKADRETEQILRKRERSCSLRRQMWNLRKNKLQKADKKYTEIEKKDEKRQIKRKTDKNSKHREWPDIWKDRRACREKDEDT
jgi:hypothetical protein